jgi:hypothetical protein
MKRNIFFNAIAILLTTAILMSSCVSTTVLQSSPTGAKLYMNGEHVGKTPYTYSDSKIVGTKTTLKITAEGYEDFNGILTRNEKADVGAIIGGCFLLVPFLWTMEYKPMHNYELVPIKK